MVHAHDKHHVVVVGGGFAGLWVTRSLRHDDIAITLVDKRNFHLFQPLLYQVATGALSPADIASPLRGILSRRKDVAVTLGEMVGVDYAQRHVLLRDGHVPYDSLVIATGSESHYFGNDTWETVAPGLKTIEDALTIRNKVFAVFEKAERENDPAERQRLLTFVIIGGGPTGVELAGALGEITRITLRDNFRSIDPTTTKILIVEGMDDILTTYPVDLRRRARESLNELGVGVITGAFAKDIDDTGVTVTKGEREERIDSRTVIWAAGVKPSSIGRMLVADTDGLDRSGRVIVNEYLTLPDHPDVYVIGDLAHVVDESGSPLPGVAPVAMSEGKYVARSIVARLEDKPVRPYRYRQKGNMAVLGRAAAIADLGWARFSGYPAWLLWLFVHLMYLVEFDNRLLVFIQWAWNYFTRNRGARLITEDSRAVLQNQNRTVTPAEK